MALDYILETYTNWLQKSCDKEADSRSASHQIHCHLCNSNDHYIEELYRLGYVSKFSRRHLLTVRRNSLPPSSEYKIVGARSSKTSENFNKTTRHNIVEDSVLHNDHRVRVHCCFRKSLPVNPVPPIPRSSVTFRNIVILSVYGEGVSDPC
jgi:hypothetical protein